MDWGFFEKFSNKNINAYRSYLKMAGSYQRWISKMNMFFSVNSAKTLNFPIHIFYGCIHVKSLWEKLLTKFQNNIILSSLTPQAAILGLTNDANKIYNLNHNLLVFKNCLQVNTETYTQYRYFIGQPNINKEKLKRISLVSNNKTETYDKKWYITDNVLLVTE